MNKSEETIRHRYEAQGYDIVQVGIPDLILLKDGKIEFVEVKYDLDTLSESQRRAFKLLRKHGFIVRVERVPKVNRSSLLEEWNKEVKVDEMRTYP